MPFKPAVSNQARDRGRAGRPVGIASKAYDWQILLGKELIGHELRKRTGINHGIIPILSRILSSRRSRSGKRATRESHGNGFQDVRGVPSDDDASCLQAAVILGILAHGRTISLLQIR
jgi:hypothetical protein